MKIFKKNCPKIRVQEVKYLFSTPSSTLGERHIFGCACLKHKRACVTGLGELPYITKHPVTEETWDSSILPHSLCQRTLGILLYHHTACARTHQGFSYINTQPVSKDMGDYLILPHSLCQETWGFSSVAAQLVSEDTGDSHILPHRLCHWTCEIFLYYRTACV